jgi:lipopolysaccharide export LptBFGC system permease protein LptF
MLSRYSNKLANYSYKIMSFNQHKILLEKNVYKPFQKELTWDNKIVMFTNIKIINKLTTEDFKFQSFVMYKFDNKKINGIQYDKENNVFLANYIDSNATIEYKKIYFDVNRINEYYKDLENLEKYFEIN